MDRRHFLLGGLAGGTALWVRRVGWPAAVLAGEPVGVETAGAAERVDDEALAVFRAAGVGGAFVLRDLATGTTTVVGAERAGRGFLPASTFKIPNTLIGLETGVVPGRDFALPWDGVRRDFVAAWNRDHDLESAMKHSVVWFFQEIARRVGVERYRSWLAKLGYGNGDLSAGVDRFWLEGGFQISPREQVDFLSRLVAGELPVEPRNVEILRSILLTAERDGVTLRAKTGLGQQGGEKGGWLVGWVERPAATAAGAAAPGDAAPGPVGEAGGERHVLPATHVFACLTLAPAAAEWRDSPVFAARRTVPLALLERYGAVPAGMPQPV